MKKIIITSAILLLAGTLTAFADTGVLYEQSNGINNAYCNASAGDFDYQKLGNSLSGATDQFCIYLKADTGSNPAGLATISFLFNSTNSITGATSIWTHNVSGLTANYSKECFSENYNFDLNKFYFIKVNSTSIGKLFAYKYNIDANSWIGSGGTNNRFSFYGTDHETTTDFNFQFNYSFYPPTASTQAPTNITDTSFKANGTIITEGEQPVNNIQFNGYWYTDDFSDYGHLNFSDTWPGGTGSFNHTFTGIPADVIISYSAKACSPLGCGTGGNVESRTLETPAGPGLTLFPMGTTTDLLAFAGTLGGDLWPIIAMLIGIPLAFFIITKSIGITKRKDNQKPF